MNNETEWRLSCNVLRCFIQSRTFDFSPGLRNSSLGWFSIFIAFLSAKIIGPLAAFCRYFGGRHFVLYVD